MKINYDSHKFFPIKIKDLNNNFFQYLMSVVSKTTELNVTINVLKNVIDPFQFSDF